MASVWYRLLKPCQLLNLGFLLPVPAVGSTWAMKGHTQARTALQLSHISADAEGKNTLQEVRFQKNLTKLHEDEICKKVTVEREREKWME